MNLKRNHLSLAISLLLLSPIAFAQNANQATVARSADLKAQPFSDAPTLKTLSENQKLDVLSRKASWMEVKAQDTVGWVKMLSLRFDSKVAESGGAGETAKSVFGFLRTGSSGSTATTAVKGWSKESFANLVPNPDAFEKVKTFSVAKQEASSFAKQENLKDQEQAYVKAQGDK